ncbi:hypothetical protein EMGBS1_06030, partial [Chloroflexota bacterium]
MGLQQGLRLLGCSRWLHGVGESIASSVEREAFEETGTHVVPVKLIGIYAGPRFD